MTESETESKPASVVPDGLDFGGETFMLLGGDAVFEVYTMATELSGDTLFNRYQAVGDRLNIRFAFTPENSTGAVGKLTSSVLAGNDSYQLAIVQRATSIAKMVGDHLLHNRNDLPYVDLTTPYWFHDAIKSLRVGDLIYYTYGDIYPMSTHVMYYNKAMLDAFDLPSPHEYALNGKWTYRDSTVEFGLLPYPKFDEAQEHYISFLNTELMCVPSTVEPALAGACTQLLAENSGGVKEAYYEYLLKEKVTRDPESAQVLDLIFGNAINDFIISYCGGMSKSSNMYNIPQTLTQRGSTISRPAMKRTRRA